MMLITCQVGGRGRGGRLLRALFRLRCRVRVRVAIGFYFRFRVRVRERYSVKSRAEVSNSISMRN